MSIYDYEAAFGAADITSKDMRSAMKTWEQLYYGTAQTDADPCQRVAYTVVAKIAKTVFGEYQCKCDDAVIRSWLEALDKKKLQAVQLALSGGECFLKPCPSGTGFSFTLIPRANVLVFGRDADGAPTDMGCAEKWVEGNSYFTLLERRTVGADGRLTLQNQLYRSSSDSRLGTQVPLSAVPRYARLPEKFTYPEPMGLGLVQLKTPILNCVDGSYDGVAVFAPAAGLIQVIDRNEAELSGEFSRGKSRILVSRDMLDENKALTAELFVGLDEDPDRVGITLFSPQLREQSYLARKQEYLRNVESIVGLKRGMLSDANMEDRTATEISASAADYNLTVMAFQQMWEQAVLETVQLCRVLAGLYGLEVPGDGQVAMDWGNGVLYDEEVTWQGYLQMVKEGLLRPEIALGWRFGMAAGSEEELAQVRKRLMPDG